jgi:hypothetical protein
MAGHSGVVGRVFRVAVTEVVLDQAQIGAAVGESEAAGVPQHVGMDVRQPGARGRGGDQIVDGLPGERLVALRHKQPGQTVATGREIALDGPQFVASDRVLDGEAVLEPSHPEPRLVEVDLVAAQADRLTDAQAVAVHHQHQQVVADAVPPAPSGIEQRGDFGSAEEILAPLVTVDGAGSGTFDSSPLGRRCGRHANPAVWLDREPKTFDKIRFSSKVDGVLLPTPNEETPPS